MKGFSSSSSSRSSRSSQNSEYEDETKLPYTRQEINADFRIPPGIGEQTYDIQECYEVIKDNLYDLGQYKYDFLYSSDTSGENMFEDNLKGILKLRSIKRKVKLRFICENCKDKNWTSIVGTMQMDFQFKKHQQENKRKYPYLLIFDLTIYRMQCVTCHQYGVPTIYQSQLQTFAKSANIVLTQILDEVPPPRYHDNRYKLKEQIHGHIQELCEACKLKRCFARPKPK